jgi:hypothetical protein
MAIINGRARVGVRVVVGPSAPSVDADAQAFITAAGITNPTQQTAINTLVVDLKGYGIWTKMKALYPFVGGTASAHKFNLKDPRDLDAAFRLVFSGGWTHSSNGALPNGTNAYGDTKLIPNTVLSQNSMNISFYSRTNSTGNYFDIGAANSSYPSAGGVAIVTKWSDNNSYTNAFGNTENNGSIFANTQGLFILKREISTSVQVFRNNTLGRSYSSVSTTPTTNSIFISAFNQNGAINYSNREISFATIGDGLTNTQASNLYTAVQAFQTTLGRQV